jgi:matrixin
MVLLLASACGGGGSPTSTSGSVAVATLDGITGAAVTATGPTAAVPGTAAEFAAGGFFTRATLVPRDGRIYLWPVTVDEAYTRAIVYETWSFAGTQRLFRWPGASVTITPGVWGEALAEMASTATVTFVPSATPEIEVVVDANDPDIVAGFVGFTRCTTSGYAIAHCRVVLRDVATSQSSTMAHELGHTLGLGHSVRPTDLMYQNARTRAGRFSNDERVLLTMMYARRRAGNGPPDDDRSLAAATRTVFTLAIGN